MIVLITPLKPGCISRSALMIPPPIFIIETHSFPLYIIKKTLINRIGESLNKAPSSSRYRRDPRLLILKLKAQFQLGPLKEIPLSRVRACPSKNIFNAACMPPGYLPPGLIRRCVARNRLRARTTRSLPRNVKYLAFQSRSPPVVTRNPGRGRFFSAAERKAALPFYS